MKTQILGGLAENDVVATGYSIAVTHSDIAPDEQSPFAPQPPGRNKKK